jgi:hypothetical protein
MRSPREVMAMCTRGPSMVQGFALNVCGCTLNMVRRRPPKCVIDVIGFPVFTLTKFTGLLPRGRYVETLDTPEHPTPTGHYDHSLPAYFELDVGWGPAKLH